MFLRPHYRSVDGKRHAYWSLVESVGTERGPRQRVVAYLGGLDEADRLGVQQAAAPNSAIDNQPSLFDDESTPPWYVDVSKVRVENCREFGGPWLAWPLIRHLGQDEFLQQTIPWRSAVIHATSDRTASRSASAWSSRGAACRWGRKSSPGTRRT